MIGMIRRILGVSGKYQGRIYGAMILSFFKGMLMKVPAIATFLIVSAYIDGELTKRACIYAAIALMGSVAVQAMLQYLADRLQSAAGYMIFADMRMKLGEHLRRLPMGFFTEGNIGRISSVLSTDMVFIEENCMAVLADIMSYLFSQAIMIVFMFLFDWRLGLTSLAVTSCMILLGRGMIKSDLLHSKKRQDASEIQTEAVLDFTEGIGIIKTYNLLGEKSKELTDSFEHNCKVNLEFEEKHAPWARGVNMIYAVGTVLVLAISTFLYFKGDMSLNYYIGMLLFLFDLFVPIKTFYDQEARLTVMSACMDRIEALFAEKELDDSGTQMLTNDNAPEIEYRNVTFAYDKKDILKNVSFKADKGTMTALVGPSGGGKSTIASLLARFWDIQSGEILLRGTDIRKIPLAVLMDNISMVFQRVYLFQDTVYNNIALGRPDASREEIIKAAKKARCYDFIMELPDGFDTVIGEGGASLSGGQAQRLSIARCILKDSPIVILDEATASVDADNESYIQQAISELCKGKTLLVIAHRLNTIVGADNIMVIKDGQIAESGVHVSLMQKNGIYRSMVTKRAVSTGWKN
ncbi:ABC transporter ATP-binding protein [Ruminococcus flavefaciens]|uniref:ATP-binding cassette, subfamily B n=1 Tax=Ruminococcus flavefaciens TaxID=1265 RepID=A0A1M7KEH3_RUMFL|nr:ABC transporter ATP-binding protein [Ruminococcus flavefaciens]SHM63692.1 ATP-binding cassette, subfamily B [Ruminococcus flavefaciens]